MSLPKRFLNDCTTVALFIAAIEVVSGIPFGQTCTQFCALPHPVIPPVSINPSKRSLLFISPVGLALNKRAWDNAAGPINVAPFLSFTFGQASKHTPHVIHFDSSYAHCRFFSGILGPGPISYVPSIGTHALICFNTSNIFSRFTIISRKTGNVVIGSNRINCTKLSTSVAQDCRAVPLITIEQTPHTSSIQLISHSTGDVCLPSTVTGFF